MTKRSFVSLLLALMMLLCVTSALAEEPVTIHVYGLGATIPETDPVLPELGNRLGLKIVVDTAAGGADAATGLMTRMMDNDIPDVFRVGDLNNLAVYHESDAVLDLTPYGTRPLEEYDDFVQELYSLYNLSTYLDAATETLTELGYIK